MEAEVNQEQCNQCKKNDDSGFRHTWIGSIEGGTEIIERKETFNGIRTTTSTQYHSSIPITINLCRECYFKKLRKERIIQTILWPISIIVLFFVYIRPVIILDRPFLVSTVFINIIILIITIAAGLEFLIGIQALTELWFIPFGDNTRDTIMKEFAEKKAKELGRNKLWTIKQYDKLQR